MMVKRYYINFLKTLRRVIVIDDILCYYIMYMEVNHLEK